MYTMSVSRLKFRQNVHEKSRLGGIRPNLKTRWRQDVSAWLLFPGPVYTWIIAATPLCIALLTLSSTLSRPSSPKQGT